MSKHRASSQPAPDGGNQPGNGRHWKRYWQAAKALLQVTAAQVIAYILRRWWE
jgi:hypothetical protein